MGNCVITKNYTKKTKKSELKFNYGRVL